MEFKEYLNKTEEPKEVVVNEAKFIMTLKELMNVKKTLGVNDNWHEPDEQNVTVSIKGKTFDNASVDGEIIVTLYKDKKPVADMNLATLFAYATGYKD